MARSAASLSFSTARWAAATGGAGAARVDRALQPADFLGQFPRGTGGEFVAQRRPCRGAWHRWQSAANCVTIGPRASDGLRKGDIDGEGSAERQQRPRCQSRTRRRVRCRITRVWQGATGQVLNPPGKSPQPANRALGRARSLSATSVPSVASGATFVTAECCRASSKGSRSSSCCVASPALATGACGSRAA